jgi:hypothetical protein
VPKGSGHVCSQWVAKTTHPIPKDRLAKPQVGRAGIPGILFPEEESVAYHAIRHAQVPLMKVGRTRCYL